MNSGRPISPRVRTICEETANAASITVEDLFSKSHSPHIVSARNAAMTRVRDEARLSYPHIGAIFNRHHASVMYGVRNHRAKGIIA